jgi:hypothetical protein
MRTIFTTAFLIVMVLFFVSTNKTLAGANDTLVVYANSSLTLDQTINSDTTSGGAQLHKAYKLVSLDTTYVFLGSITVKSDFTVIGVLGSNGRPPCIQPGILGDGSMASYLFVLNANNIKGVFKNLYLTGLSIDNTISQTNVNGVGALIQISADYIKLYVDNVIFEDWPENAISYSGNWDDFFVTNCKFRNMISATQWYSGEGIRNQTNAAITDTMVMKYNTFLCINSYAAGPVTVSYVKYFDFSHNSIIYNFQNPFWIFNVTDAKVNDNVFYGNWVGGITKDEYTGFWDQLWSLEVGSLIDLDTLDIAKAKFFDPADSASANLRWLAEAKRNIEVKNNVYFWSKSVTDYWTAWNDTAHTDSLYTPTWMNHRTTGMFTDKAHWPGLVQSGNQEVDPGFGSSIDQVLFNNKGNGVGLFQYMVDIRTNAATTDIYGYQLQSASGANWIPAWPLPELADMKYSNAALKTAGTDGKPVGDPGWFTGGYTGVVKTPSGLPTTFSLSNAYPNPFNPTTNIQFSVAKSENVKLVIFNILGQKIMTLVNGEMKPGKYTATWNGKDEFGSSVASGIYFYRLESQSFNSTKKMILMK